MCTRNIICVCFWLLALAAQYLGKNDLLSTCVSNNFAFDMFRKIVFLLVHFTQKVRLKLVQPCSLLSGKRLFCLAFYLMRIFCSDLPYLFRNHLSFLCFVLIYM